jgi:Rrf2 family iron-sulfur cluster assembly transcriptional regulator
MVELALDGGQTPILGQEIAERQAISADYVAQLFRKLGAAGLIEGVKGPGGGYRLARDAAEITAGDIVQAVEGSLAIVHCVDPEDGEHCERQATCVTHRLWERLSNVMREYLDSVTLQDLRQEAHALGAPESVGRGGGAGAEPVAAVQQTEGE